MALATDYADGIVARRRGTASAGGQLFDHATDCLFVTAGLAGAALAGLVPPVLPVLIPVAFGQYVFDSYLVHHQKRLRMSTIGRWNGIGYFVPLVVIAAARLEAVPSLTAPLLLAARLTAYGLNRLDRRVDRRPRDRRPRGETDYASLRTVIDIRLPTAPCGNPYSCGATRSARGKTIPVRVVRVLSLAITSDESRPIWTHRRIGSLANGASETGSP